MHKDSGHDATDKTKDNSQLDDLYGFLQFLTSLFSYQNNYTPSMKKSQVFRKPYRIKKKKSIFENRFFWLIFLILIIFGSAFYFLLFSEFFQIKNIIITGEQKVSKEDIKLNVEKKLETKILFFKTKSIFSVNLNEIKESILTNFPLIGEVEIKQDFPDALNLVMVERKEIGIFCKGEPCFLIDNEGVIFENTTSSLPLLKINSLIQNKELKLGDKVLENGLLLFILEIESKLKEELKISLKEILIVSDERLNIETLEDWEIYFNTKKDINWQLTKLKAVLEKYIPPEKRENLEYIELRFGDLAPFKYRELEE